MVCLHQLHHVRTEESAVKRIIFSANMGVKNVLQHVGMTREENLKTSKSNEKITQPRMGEQSVEQKETKKLARGQAARENQVQRGETERYSDEETEFLLA